ncbi:MAG: helix-turn-helix domain-containing protein [Candidatus Azobacteroides sp.]|nr:helix-turn-helix domain-containing protein [Candidatus Azobacteroides sp.]
MNLFVWQVCFGRTGTGNEMPNSDNVYPEIEEYRRTLTPEREQAYQQALAHYNSQSHPLPSVTKNHRLSERFNQVINLPETDAAQVSDKIFALQRLSADAGRKRETCLEMECLYRAFMLAFWSQYRQYDKGFELALIMEERLANITEDQYPDCRNAYFRISEGYYLFKDYDKSIELALHAITDNPARSFTDRANLEGRKILAMAYGMIGEFDISDQYIRSTWGSGDIVEDRPVFDAVALAHMACNEMDKGNWRKALALNTEVLDYLKTTDDYGHVAGMYACQCFCYFGLGEPENVGSAADSILVYTRRDWYNQNKRLKQAYKNLSRYNGIIANIPKMQEYQDSLVAIYEREQAAATSQYILRAEQEIARSKLLARDETLRHQWNFIIVVLFILILSIVFLVIILRLYRSKQAAYKTLAVKAQQWAKYSDNSTSMPVLKDDVESESLPTEDETQQAEKLKEFMNTHTPYTDPELTLEGLAGMLGVNRSQLSRIINRSFGVNFNQFVNEYRVKAAIRIMSDAQSAHLSTEQIIEQAGFNSRSSFYQMFKQTTGLTPAQYRKTKVGVDTEVTH